jgi:hypothetical protein
MVVKFISRICNESNAIVKELYSFIVFFYISYILYCTFYPRKTDSSFELLIKILVGYT